MLCCVEFFHYLNFKIETFRGCWADHPIISMWTKLWILLSSMWSPIFCGTDVADVVFNINPSSKIPECWQDNDGEWNCYERYKPRFCNDRYECSWDTPILSTINANCYDDHDNLQWICDSWEFYNVTKDSPGCVKVDGVGGIGGRPLTVSTGLANYFKSSGTSRPYVSLLMYL